MPHKSLDRPAPLELVLAAFELLVRGPLVVSRQALLVDHLPDPTNTEVSEPHAPALEQAEDPEGPVAHLHGLRVRLQVVHRGALLQEHQVADPDLLVHVVLQVHLLVRLQRVAQQRL